MARPMLPPEIQNKIRQMKSEGMGMKPIGRELKISHTTVERVLYPERVRRREKKSKYSPRLIRLDKHELPPGNFDVYAIQQDWLTG